jgi:hypothetical protein
LLLQGAKDYHEGCYTTQKPLEFAPCRIAGTDKEDSLHVHWKRSPADSIENLEKTLPFYKRVYILQERLLSPRVLYFEKHGLAFNCECLFANETDYDSAPWPLQSTSRWDPALCYDPLSSLDYARHRDWGRLDVSYLHDIWFNVVRHYSPLQITRPPDKLVALSRLAQVFADRGVHRYLAGLWEQTPYH